MTYQEALEYLDSFLNYEQITAYRYPEVFSLDRVEGLLRRLGNPHCRYPTLHVAGTKGKGSTCAFAASILSAVGLKTGLYTSPHLFSFRERMRINGEPIPGPELAEIVCEIQPAASRDLTYFEVTTACAFLYFARAEVDAAVIEVGLGGRLDATNTLLPEVTAITPISLDHMSKLGNTLGEIAREKAGILKPGVPAVIAPQSKEAMRVIEQVAAEQGVPLHLMEEEVRIEQVELDASGSRATFHTPLQSYRALEIPLLGRHQLENVAMAVRMVELLGRPLGQSVREGIGRTSWPGRCQLIDGNPPILLDGAQNAASAQILKETVEELFPGRKLTAIVGISTDKDLDGIAAALGPWIDRLILTKASSPRAESPQRLAERFQAWHAHPELCASVSEALQRATAETYPEGLIVVTGSLFVVAESLLGSLLPLSLAAEQEENSAGHSGEEGDGGAQQGKREGPRGHDADRG